MSFAPNKKDTTKKSGKSPGKPSQNKSPPNECNPVKERVILLEEIVAKLEQQHSMFEPLLELLNQAPDVMALEEQARSFQDKANFLEEKIGWQHMQATEIEKKTSEVSIPAALSEGHSTSSRSLPQMMAAVAEIESNVQAIATKRRANAKRHEDASKERFGKSIDSLKVDLTDVQAFLKDKTAKFLKDHQEKIQSLEERGSQLKERQRQDQAFIEEALERHAKLGEEAGESWLQLELNSRVKDALEDLSKHLDYNYRQLDITYKQDLLKLRNSFQRVISMYFSVVVQKKPAAEAVNGRAEAIQSLSERIDVTLTAQTYTLREIAQSLHEIIEQLVDKASRFNSTFNSVDEPEKTELLNAGRDDFAQWLQGLWYNVDLLRTNIEKLEEGIGADTTKLSELLQEIQAQNAQKHSEVAPLVARASKNVEGKVTEAKHTVLEVTSRLFGVWKAVDGMAPWTIEFAGKKPEDSEAFEETPAINLSNM